MDDVTYLLAQAARFRRLARDILDTDAERKLLALATEYENRAAADQAPTTDPLPPRQLRIDRTDDGALCNKIAPASR